HRALSDTPQQILPEEPREGGLWTFTPDTVTKGWTAFCELESGAPGRARFSEDGGRFACIEEFAVGWLDLPGRRWATSDLGRDWIPTPPPPGPDPELVDHSRPVKGPAPYELLSLLLSPNGDDVY